ncbi:AlpA family phage regulatory protein [Cupriavidus basilensis]
MAKQIQAALAILRRKQVEQETGLSRSTIYLRIKLKTFPPAVQLGPRAVGWRRGER